MKKNPTKNNKQKPCNHAVKKTSGNAVIMTCLKCGLPVHVIKA